MMKKYSLNKEERLKSRKFIETLFSKDAFSITDFPLKLLWREVSFPVNQSIQTAFSVSQKNFRRAVDRNRIKRLMKESFRLNKFIVYDVLKGKKKQFILMWLYTGKELPEQNLVSGKIILILNRLSTMILKS